MAYRPIVFISSTSDDLTKYREQAAAAAEASGFAVSRMEYWSDNGWPTVAACLEKVNEAEGVEFFLHKLDHEHCLVMLDGLDEAPEARIRERIARIFERGRCGDWYGGYEMRSQENPSGPKDGEAKVLRGGSWGFKPGGVRVSSRFKFKPTNRVIFFGFRCAGELR